MIYGLQSDLINEEYTGDLESSLLIENFEMTTKLLAYDMLNEGSDEYKGISIIARIKIYIQKFITTVKAFIKKMITFIKTRHKDKVVFYSSFNNILDKYNVSNYVLKSQLLAIGDLDDNELFKSIFDISKEEFKPELFYDKNSEKEIVGKDAYKKYVELLTTLEKNIGKIKMDDIAAKSIDAKLKKSYGDLYDAGDLKEAEKSSKSAIDALIYAIKVQMKAINMALADAGKDDTKEKSDNE